MMNQEVNKQLRSSKNGIRMADLRSASTDFVPCLRHQYAPEEISRQRPSFGSHIPRYVIFILFTFEYRFSIIE